MPMPWLNESLILNTSLYSLQIFFVVLVVVIVRHGRQLFLDSHGWSHRLAGAVHLSWLVYGTFLVSDSTINVFFYNVILGLSGTLLTITAALDFPHKYVRNAVGQSGTLSENAMVTRAEMIEHAFYQFLNLWQVLYLHAIPMLKADWQRWCALLAVAAPWWWRRSFPVHSFSHNWTKAPTNKRTAMESLLYRIKKSQYLFYKHVILHGINLSQCVRPAPLVELSSWRLFWLCLNTSYVMEFFLQSLVKRHVLSQAQMLILNRWLMLVSSVTAIAILETVDVGLCGLSLVLNLVHRHHDVLNTMAIATFTMMWRHYRFER